PMTQWAQFDASLENQRILARLAMFFGLLAALLVATGLYGTLAYKVARRTGEIGVRMALGARRGQVLGMVLRESLGLTGMGVLIGLPLAYVGAMALRGVLYGVGRFDAATFVAAVLGLVAIALLASWLPARRAAGVDPLIALRTE
ncbi:MAG: FtsX-like permease family protein, partial [Terriglobales bacterium]